MNNLEKIANEIATFKDALPPVQSWHPDRDSAMDLTILRDGRWIHEGGEIKRPALVKLLASVMRREPDGRYALVTPQERVYIEVQDVPFLIVDWNLIEGERGVQMLQLESNLGEYLLVNDQNSLWLEADEAVPYAMIREGLAARFTRAAYYRLAEVLEERDGRWGIESNGFFNALGS